MNKFYFFTRLMEAKKTGRPKTLIDYDVKALSQKIKQKCKDDGRILAYVLWNDIGITIDTWRRYVKLNRIDPVVLENCFTFLGEPNAN